ncbi:MAG: tRNA pseudouridine synthase A, partial [Lentisphaeria bacterium]|nr:tRNA pseudouridine synthase A [Lentisphaeria bacterium]
MGNEIKNPAYPEEGSPERTVKMELAYDGTAYHGWQRQPNGINVQEVVEERLCKLFGGKQIRIQGSSRTDAGVHALGLVASCKLPEHPLIPTWKVHKALNRLLPPDIRIRSIEEMPEDFNARFSAHAKSYVYVVNTGDINPFTNRYSWLLDDMTDIDSLRKAIQYLEGEHDFSTFTVDRGSIDDPVRLILKTDVTTFGPLVCMR